MLRILSSLGILYEVGFSTADCTGDISTHKSTTGYVFNSSWGQYLGVARDNQQCLSQQIKLAAQNVFHAWTK